MNTKSDWITPFGGFFLIIGFHLVGFVVVYKIVDLVFWLINGHWFGYKFYDFCDWIGLTYWNTAFMTGWVGLDSLIYEHIILKSFAYGTMTIAGVLCVIGLIFTYMGDKLDRDN